MHGEAASNHNRRHHPHSPHSIVRPHHLVVSIPSNHHAPLRPNQLHHKIRLNNKTFSAYLTLFDVWNRRWTNWRDRLQTHQKRRPYERSLRILCERFLKLEYSASQIKANHKLQSITNHMTASELIRALLLHKETSAKTLICCVICKSSCWVKMVAPHCRIVHRERVVITVVVRALGKRSPTHIHLILHHILSKNILRHQKMHCLHHHQHINMAANRKYLTPNLMMWTPLHQRRTSI
mmetsp:Transcript_352/g.1315  ORF Transcript_352/g.1315 Transcript_352/m.1315 type:complete len:237 (+) Transcript_352:2199-2909(+)